MAIPIPLLIAFGIQLLDRILPEPKQGKKKKKALMDTLVETSAAAQMVQAVSTGPQEQLWRNVSTYIDLTVDLLKASEPAPDPAGVGQQAQ